MTLVSLTAQLCRQMGKSMDWATCGTLVLKNARYIIASNHRMYDLVPMHDQGRASAHVAYVPWWGWWGHTQYSIVPQPNQSVPPTQVTSSPVPDWQEEIPIPYDIVWDKAHLPMRLLNCIIQYRSVFSEMEWVDSVDFEGLNELSRVIIWIGDCF